MNKVVIHPQPPQHRTPYSPGVLVKGGKLLFIAGMTALPLYHKHPHDPEELKIPEDIKEQTRRAFNNIKLVLNAVGGDFKNIVSMRRYLTRIEEQDQVNEVMWEIFGDDLPTTTTVEVKSLVVREARVELEAIAVV
ncbi:MAG: RidA family protein [Candidatus Caldarchaeum sp.]|uniref:RidA family protein n=1 Tax=Caldiarchaeum subterraneum TaxID=311458 RepID=A0A7C5QP26_CALS0